MAALVELPLPYVRPNKVLNKGRRAGRWSELPFLDHKRSTQPGSPAGLARPVELLLCPVAVRALDARVRIPSSRSRSRAGSARLVTSYPSSDVSSRPFPPLTSRHVLPPPLTSGPGGAAGAAQTGHARRPRPLGASPPLLLAFPIPPLCLLNCSDNGNSGP